MKRKLMVGRVYFTNTDETYYLPAGPNEELTNKYAAKTPEESEELIKNDGYINLQLFTEEYSDGKKTWRPEEGGSDCDYIATWVVEK